MKGPIVTVLAFALAVAGCVSLPVDTASLEELPAALDTNAVFHTAGGLVAAAATDGLAAVGGAFHTGLAAAEPTIGITSDGSIFMTANTPNPSCGLAPTGCPPVPYANFQKGPTIVRSQDKGQTWTDVFPKLPTGDSYKGRTWDPYVLVDRDTDRVFMDDIYPVGCGFMSWSDDLGSTWMHNPAACGNPHLNDHQTIVTAKPRVLQTVGYENLVYRCVNNGLYAACAISVNGGQTFLPQVPIGPTFDECAAITGHLESDAEGRVYLGMPCNGGVGVVKTEDDGRTWTLAMVSDEGFDGHDVDLAVDEAGNVYALFLRDGLPWFSKSTDHGETWSEPVMVGAPGVTMAKFNAIAAGAPGRVAFAYVGTTIPDAPSLPEPECGILPALPCTDPEAWADATWNAYIGIMTDALADDPVIQTVAANDPADPLARGACADRCHGMTDFIDIQIDAEGRPWASFVDVCVAECVTDKSVLFDGNLGLAGSVLAGPALRGELAALPAILPQAAHPTHG